MSQYTTTVTHTPDTAVTSSVDDIVGGDSTVNKPAVTAKWMLYRGVILDEATRAPVAAARITMNPSVQESAWYSNSRGRFSFWASGDVVSMRIEHEDYEPYESSTRFKGKDGALGEILLKATTAATNSPANHARSISRGGAILKLMPVSPSVVPAIMSADSGAKTSGSGSQWSRWYRLGVGAAPRGYTVFRVDFWLSGDRSCGTSADCREVERSNRQVLWEFRLRGHDDAGAPRITQSEAHIRVMYLAK